MLIGVLQLRNVSIVHVPSPEIRVIITELRTKVIIHHCKAYYVYISDLVDSNAQCPAKMVKMTLIHDNRPIFTEFIVFSYGSCFHQRTSY